MAKTYYAANHAAPTTAAPAPVTTGTAIKTLLQLAPPSGADLTIVAWGITFDGAAAAAPIKVELIETDVAATVTAHAAAGIVRWNADGVAVASALVAGVGTTTTGYTASAEGTTTASRLLDFQQVPPNGGYLVQYPLGREPKVQPSKFLRIRVTAAAAVNAHCWVQWEE